MFSMAFDSESLAAIARFAGMQVLLDTEIAAALVEAGKTLTEAAQENTWRVFSNPSGALASTIYPWLASPQEMEVRVDSPYGARREYGFSGRTDSLGRTYVNDPAKPFLAPALEEHTPEVQAIIEAAVLRVLDRVATGGR